MKADFIKKKKMICFSPPAILQESMDFSAAAGDFLSRHQQLEFSCCETESKKNPSRLADNLRNLYLHHCNYRKSSPWICHDSNSKYTLHFMVLQYKCALKYTNPFKIFTFKYVKFKGKKRIGQAFLNLHLQCLNAVLKKNVHEYHKQIFSLDLLLIYSKSN